MTIRLRLSLTGARGRITSRQFSGSSHPAAARAEAISRPSTSQRSIVQDRTPLSEPQNESGDFSLPVTPTSRLVSKTNRTTPPRRPGVKPPPTLALPLSMHPPPPLVPLPNSSKRVAMPDVDVPEGSEKTFDIYMKSLKHTYTEPSLEDLDALRPPPSAIRAALEGVVGSGRTLLPQGHSLYLTIDKLGAQEVSIGGGPKAKKTVIAGSKKAKQLEYNALYMATQANIARGFTVAQLKRFEMESAEQMGSTRIRLPAGTTDNKPKIIHRIMNTRWGMIPPLEIKKLIDKESAVLEQDYPVSPSELFIFLGRDGENLLQLARDLQMRISVDRKPSSKPVDANNSAPRSGFLIRASGKAANHEKLKEHLDEQRSLMAHRMVILPTGPALSQVLLQNISRISGAFVENASFKGLENTENPVPSVLITARSSRNAYTAERLVQRAAMETAHRSGLQLFSFARPEEHMRPNSDLAEPSSSRENGAKYTLYPFGAQGFRIRAVQYTQNFLHDYSAHTSRSERIMSSDEAMILTGRDHSHVEPTIENMVTITLKGEIADLIKYIAEEPAGVVAENKTRRMTATFGHVVFQAENASALVSPVPEPVPLTSILEWAEKQDAKARFFIPGQVPSTAQSVLDKLKPIHRLQYRTIEGGQVINVDVELPDDEPEPTQNDGRLDSEDVNSNDDAAKSVENAEPVEVADQTIQEPTSLPTDVRVGTEAVFELLMPNSTMDVHMQVSDVSSMDQGTIPEALNTYLNQLSEFFTTDIDNPQPDPPQELSVDGKRYMLVKNTSARYGIEPSLANLPAGCIATTEASLDLENNSRLAFTQLIYDGTGGTDGWEQFIRTCQRLGAQPYQQSTEVRVNPT